MKRFLYTSSLLLLGFMSLSAQVQLLDEFHTLITRPANVQAVAEQADGKILLAGAMNQANTLLRDDIIRLTAAGDPDPSFEAILGDTVVTALAVQKDQKILVGGYVLQNDEETGVLFRLHSDGSLDASFQVDTFNNRIMTIEYLDNDRIVVGGIFRTYGQQPSTGMLMLNNDGSLLRTFSFSTPDDILFVHDILAEGNQFYIGGNIGSDAQLLRFSESGDHDTEFSIDKSVGTSNFMTSINHLARMSNGSIVFTAYTWEFDPQVVIVTPIGRRVSANSIPNPLGLAVTNQDQVLVSGELNGRPDVYLTGVTGPTPFVPGSEADDQVYQLRRLSSGAILVTGRFGLIKDAVREGVALMMPNRSLSNDFSPEIKQPGSLNQVVHTPSGKILIGGDFTQVNGSRIVNLARLQSDGTLDPTFLQTTVPSNKAVRAITLLDQGKIMVGTSTSSIDAEIRTPIFRLHDNGTLDNTFQIAANLNILGNIKGFTPLPDGRIIAYGAFSIFGGAEFYQQLALFNTNGSFDPQLSSRVRSGAINAVHLRNNELVLAGRNIQLENQDASPATAINLSGNPTNTFMTTLDNLSRIEEMIPLSDGGYLLSGRLFDGLSYREVMRVKYDGSRDNAFVWPIYSNETAPSAPPRDVLELGNGDLVLTNLSREEQSQLYIVDPAGTVKEIFPIQTNARYIDLEAINDSTAYLGGAFSYSDDQSSLLKVQFYGNNSNTLPVDTVEQTPGNDLSFHIEGGALAVGESICLNVSADNLQAILGILMEINYDPDVLSFEGLGHLDGLPGLLEGDFGLPGNSSNPEGTIRLAWLEPLLAGYTAEGTTNLFSLCFTAIAPSTGTSVRIVNTELVNAQDQFITATVSADPVVITASPLEPDTLTVQIGSATVREGAVVCIPVTASDFVNIMAAEFTINYDTAALQYQSLQNFNLPGLNLSTFGVPGTGANQEGQIKMAWFDMEVNGVTLPDETVLFEMCFLARTDFGTTELTFSDVDINRDVDQPLGFRGLTGQVSFLPVDGPAIHPTNISLFNNTARMGETVCIPVEVSNFMDLIGMGFTLNYDPEKLSFQSLQQFNLPNLGEDFFDLPGTGTLPEGQLAFTWFDLTTQGVTVPDQTTIFEVCFLVIESSGTTDLSFSDVVVIGSDGDERPFQTQSAAVSLFPEDNQTIGEGDLGLLIDNESVQVGDDFCVQFTTKNFTDILGLQFTVTYDPDMLTYNSVGNFNLDGLSSSIGVPGAGSNPPGQLKVAWLDLSLEGVDLEDGTVLFEMCFTAKAAGTTRIAFSNVEVTGVVVDNIPFVGNTGTIVVAGEGTQLQNDNFTLSLEGTTASEGGSFCLPIHVSDFDGIGELSFSCLFDPQLLSYHAAINMALPGLAESVELINGTNGQVAGIRINWADQTGAGVTLPDDAVLLELCFKGNSAGVGSITFADASVLDKNGTPVNFNGVPGIVTIEADSQAGTQFFTLTVASDTVTMGESFCLDVSVENFTNVLGVKLNIDYDPDLLTFEGIQNFNLKGLDNRSFEVPGINGVTPGRIRLSWIDQDLQGVSLEDGTMIFQICFQAAEQHAVGTVSLSDPNILDVDGNVLNFVGVGALVMIEEQLTTSTYQQEMTRERYRLFPVPASTEVRLTALQKSFDYTPYRVVDQRGAIVSQGELYGTEARLPVYHLGKGLYHLVIFEDASYWSLPFIKL